MIHRVPDLRLGCLFAAFLLTCSQCDGASFVFSDHNSVTINDSDSPPTTASLYPSPIVVTGLAGQTVTKATVTLHGLSHTFPSDIDILLVGPQGQTAMLVSEVGGGSDGIGVTNLTLILDDDGYPLPIEDPLISGTFKPTVRNYPLAFDFPAPAPPGNSNAVVSLDAFQNTDPTGTWNLFIVDDTAGDSGVLSGGWDLSLTVAVPLRMLVSPTNVVLSWPSSAPNYALQYSTNLAAASSWSNVLTASNYFSGSYFVTNPVIPPRAFYRLIGP